MYLAALSRVKFHFISWTDWFLRLADGLKSKDHVGIHCRLLAEVSSSPVDLAFHTQSSLSTNCK